jgi:1,4-alpha-glucan branching enzyme
MHDMFHYFKLDPVFRKFNQNDITFSMLYAFSENFVLPISHDEVVHMKGSLIGKMPGDEWRKFANVRAFLSYMWGHPGKKLLFMGQEIGQYEEWNENVDVRWHLLQYDLHRQLQSTVRELNKLYKSEPAMYQVDFHYTGFEWIDCHDVDNSIISFVRRAEDPNDFLVFVCNFTPVPRPNYRIGVPEKCRYTEIFNSDAKAFGGSGVGNGGHVESGVFEQHNRPYSVQLSLPPLGVLILKPKHA